jgi:hypothetical protein
VHGARDRLKIPAGDVPGSHHQAQARLALEPHAGRIFVDETRPDDRKTGRPPSPAAPGRSAWQRAWTANCAPGLASAAGCAPASRVSRPSSYQADTRRQGGCTLRQWSARTDGHRPQSGRGLAYHATVRQAQARHGPADHDQRPHKRGGRPAGRKHISRLCRLDRCAGGRRCGARDNARGRARNHLQPHRSTFIAGFHPVCAGYSGNSSSPTHLARSVRTGGGLIRAEVMPGDHRRSFGPVPLENRIRLVTCRSSARQAAWVYSLISPPMTGFGGSVRCRGRSWWRGERQVRRRGRVGICPGAAGPCCSCA